MVRKHNTIFASFFLKKLLTHVNNILFPGVNLSTDLTFMELFSTFWHKSPVFKQTLQGFKEIRTLLFHCRNVSSNPGKEDASLHTPEISGNLLLDPDHSQITFSLLLSNGIVKSWANAVIPSR